MNLVFVSGAKITAVPSNGESIEYEMDLQLDEQFGQIVELSYGGESVFIMEGAWQALKDQIDGLFKDIEA